MAIDANLSSNLSSRFPEGEMRSKGDYKYYLPGDIFASQKLAFNDKRLMKLLEAAARSLGSFAAQIEYVLDVELSVDFYIKKEATHSTRIEGTQVSGEEAFIDKEEMLRETNKADWDELQQCFLALKQGANALKNLPLGERVIRDCHRMLMQQPRGRNKAPGEYRKVQNWIGGSAAANAVFVPPAPEYVDEAMRNLEAFIQDRDTDIPELIKIALIHWQFESIHPFLDGNGRMGRILILLYLMEKKVMFEPILNMSAFFERNRHDYFYLLNDARKGEDQLIEWVRFFLTGVAIEAESGKEKTQKIIDLKNKIMQEKLPDVRGQKKKAQEFVKFLFHHPYVDTFMLQERLSLSRAAIYMLLDEFVRVGILEEITGGRRNRLFKFKDYIRIFMASNED